MPAYQKWHYVCPITGQEVVQDNASLPERWGDLVREFYSPEALYIIAQRILAHPDSEYNDILGASYPDKVLDDWREKQG
jgi:hypothetical protein